MALISCGAVAVVVFGCCWLRIRLMPEPVYDWPRWWYLLWIVWLPRLAGRVGRR
jgi:hypothetical protein